MTVNKLHKLLCMFIKQGHARKEVLVSKTTFKHALESDGCTLLPIEEVYGQCINMIDDDGGTKFNKDGSESMRSVIIIAGQTLEDQEAERMMEIELSSGQSGRTTSATEGAA